MKNTHAVLLAATLSAIAAHGQSLAMDESFRQAVQGAMDEASKAITKSAIPEKAAVAILPVPGDRDGWLAGQLKIALTAAGRTCVEGKEDPMWAEVLKEVEWDERKEDMLDNETVDRFGRLKSAQVLLSAFVRSRDLTDRYAFFEIELHATEIATKQHIWGGVFAKRHYKPGFEEVGRVDEIPVALREAMQEKMRTKIAESIKVAEKLSAVKTVAMLPLADDVGGYAFSIVRDAMTKTALTPVNLDLATLGEARLQLRDKPGQADAVLHGSLRDLSARIVETTPNSVTREYFAEVQLCIETAARAQLWSDTVVVSERGTDSLGWWDTVCEFFPSLRKSPGKLVFYPLVALVLLAALWILLHAMTRVR